MIKIEIKKKTPTINHLYYHRGNMKILSSEARALRNHIAEIIPEQVGGIGGYEDLRDVPLKVKISIFENWLTKKGDIKKKDIANREKFLIDSVFKVLDIDDKFIVESTYKKIQDMTIEKTIVEIEAAKW